jgi:light-harvesting complex 1 beta chain
MSDNGRDGLGTYLTADEAKEFHKIFIQNFMGFTVVAVIAHVLVYMWKPWLGF